MTDVLVVGAGIGGLSAALHLAASGKTVTLLEKNPAVGGKMNWLEEGGYRFDTGPTLLTMPFVLRELFERLGEPLERHLELILVDPLCRYFFPDGTQLDVSHSLDRTLEAIRKLSPNDVEGVGRFLAHGEEIYRAVARPFLYEGLGEWNLRFLRAHWKAFAQFWKLDAFRTLHDAVRQSVRDPRLVQLFNRFATYNGSSPYKTPATFAIIPYVELTMGGWYVRGGMFRIASSLAAIARERGISIQTGKEAEEILVEDGRVAGVRLQDGSLLKASSVVVNADALYAFEKLLKGTNGRFRSRERLLRRELSSSGFVLLLGVDRDYSHLAHHNIFFSRDYEKEFEEIFGRQVPPEEPTIYLSISSKTDPAMAPAGTSNMFLLVNVPARGGPYDWARNAHLYRNRVLERLRTFGMDDLEKHIRFERMMTPLDFEERFHSYRGALYGLASNNPWVAFLRPPNRSREIKGLFFAGGSTHPGGGIPLVLLSGKIAAELVLKYSSS